MSKITLTVTDLHNNKRLDKFLHDEISDISRSKLQQIVKKSGVKIDGETHFSTSFKLSTGQEVEIEIVYNNENSIKPKNIELDIVYQDDDLAVINKQAGLTVHPGAGNYDDTLVNALAYHMKDELSNIAGEARPGILHRLDRETSGLMIIAKNNFSHSKLSKDLAERLINRKYIGLVYGTLVPKIGTVKTGYAKSKRDHKRMTATFSEDKLAITNYKVLKTLYDGAFSLVEFSLETGRTHQIRFHLEHLNTRLIGEKIYGKSFNFNLGNVPQSVIEEVRAVRRQLLHSYYISFTHPRTGEELSFSTEMPEDFQALFFSN